MGFLEICKSDKLVRYGSTQTGCECDCVNSKDPKFIYTDGCLYSKTGQGGYGIYSTGLSISLANYYPYDEHRNIVPRLELKAILEAIKHVKLRHKSLDRIDIFTDCEFALAHLVNLGNGEEGPEIYNNLGASILKEIKEGLTHVYLHKVKAHSGIQGNEMADQYAKLGAKKAPKLELGPQTPPRVSSMHFSREENDEFYSKSPSSFQSCSRKRSRLSQSRLPSPSPCRTPIHPSPSPTPSAYKIPRSSCASPSPASYGPAKKTPVSAGPRNHPYNYNPKDPKPFSSSNSSKYGGDRSLSKPASSQDRRPNLLPRCPTKPPLVKS